jgi:hypothetical protein
MSNTIWMIAEILDRMEQAVANVRERLLRSTAALNQAGVPYAVVGGNAVSSWISTIDPGAIRNTRDVDILIRREDLHTASAALEKAGFVHDEVLDIVMFRDDPEGRPSEAIHILFAGEKSQPDHLLPAPDVETVDDPEGFPVVVLERLVEMKLMSNRDKDRTHVRDMIGVGLIDVSWLAKFPPPLADRLKYMLDTPQG